MLSKQEEERDKKTRGLLKGTNEKYHTLAKSDSTCIAAISDTILTHEGL